MTLKNYIEMRLISPPLIYLDTQIYSLIMMIICFLVKIIRSSLMMLDIIALEGISENMLNMNSYLYETG